MGLERTFRCPSCETERTFWLTARTRLHLGQKRKWVCTECDHVVVKIDGTVDTAASSS